MSHALHHRVPTRLHRIAILLALAGLLAACGSGDASDVSDGVGDADLDAGADVSATFPVTIEHQYGETTIEERPERVVSVGFTDQDSLLALGVVPVGIREWYGEQPFATWPWAQDALGDAEPAVLGAAEINFEQIVSLQPDLIVGVSAGLTEEEYDTLAAIAPTLTQSDEYVNYGTPWEEGFRMIATALGRVDDAEAQIAAIEDRYAEIRDAHPDFAGEATVSYPLSETEIGAYASDDTRSRLLTSLGFTIPAEIDELADGQFYSSFSLENLAELDRDLLVWIGATGDIEQRIREQPLHDTLDVVARGAEIFWTVDQGAAAGFSSPLSIPYLLETFVPQLEAAVDGDPSTPVPTA